MQFKLKALKGLLRCPRDKCGNTKGFIVYVNDITLKRLDALDEPRGNMIVEDHTSIRCPMCHYSFPLAQFLPTHKATVSLSIDVDVEGVLDIDHARERAVEVASLVFEDWLGDHHLVDISVTDVTMEKMVKRRVKGKGLKKKVSKKKVRRR